MWRRTTSNAIAVGLLLLLQGCATVGALNANKPGAPLVYAGTRLDLYALQGGCCARDRFGSEAPAYPALDLPASALLDTVLLPLSVAAALGIGVNVRGGN